MLAFTRASVSDEVGVQSPIVLLGSSREHMVGWIATARNMTYDGTNRGLSSDPSSRTATTCFFKGLKEKITVATDTGNSWLWRRICFRFRSNAIINVANVLGATSEYPLWHASDPGFTRALTRLDPSLDAETANMKDNITSLLFRGQRGYDWDRYLNAKVDTSRVDLAYDKTVTLSSGNESGRQFQFRRWHGMNKNLVYNDDEWRGGVIDPFLSVSDKRGMGDYYIIDFFDAGITGVGDDSLYFDPQATLYWHQRS